METDETACVQKKNGVEERWLLDVGGASLLENSCKMSFLVKQQVTTVTVGDRKFLV